ncbi:hypothetical protein FRC17_002220 [Serendipita sp. 399]|nr:hypothetical protein FRC17_002220 [Serendipita sp. 399]
MASSQSPIKLGESPAKHSYGFMQASEYDHRKSLEERVLKHLNSLIIVPVDEFFASVFPGLKLDEREKAQIEEKRSTLSYIRAVLEGYQARDNDAKDNNTKDHDTNRDTVNDDNAKGTGKKGAARKGTSKKSAAKKAIGKKGASRKKAPIPKTDERKASEFKAKQVALNIALVKGINECCPPESNGKQLRYFDTHVLQGEAAEPYPDVPKKEAPDGIATWRWTAPKGTAAGPYRDYPTYTPPRDDRGDDDSDDINDVDYISGQQISQTGKPNEFWTEKKSLLTPVSKNPGILFEHKTSSSYDIGWKRKKGWKLSKEQGHLFEQMDRYNMSQWAYCEPYRFLIGVTVTGELMRFWIFGPSGMRASEAFRYMEDARPLAKLFHLSQKSNFGYDVGPSTMFQPIPNDKIDKVIERCDGIATAYEAATGETEWKERWNSRITERLDGAAWLFNVKRHSKDSQGKPLPLAKGAPKQVVVLSVPIAHSTSMISRGTRCYLVFDSALVEREDIWRSTDAVEIMSHVHTMKTSWISPSRDPEYGFYQMVTDRAADNGVSRPEHLANMLAGGCIQNSKQSYSVPPKNSNAPFDTHTVGPRAINWILMKEVGKPLGRFKDTKRFLSAIRNIVETLRALYGLEILHRDISSGNVLINVANEEGLLIDLDLAKDLKVNDATAGPYRTASLLDLINSGMPAYESHRNKGGVTCGFSNAILLKTAQERAECLESIFPKGRKDFLGGGHFDAGADTAWKYFIKTLQKKYFYTYSSLEQLGMHVEALRELLPALKDAVSSLGDAPDGAKESDIILQMEELEAKPHPAHFQQHDNASMGNFVREVLELGSPVAAIFATSAEQNGFFSRLSGSLRNDIKATIEERERVGATFKYFKLPDCDMLVEVLNDAIEKYVPGQEPAVINESVVKTTYRQRMQIGDVKWTSSSTSRSRNSKRQRTSNYGDEHDELDDDSDDGNNPSKRRKGRDGIRL